jgi:hypothetical protein
MFLLRRLVKTMVFLASSSGEDDGVFASSSGEDDRFCTSRACSLGVPP